MIQGARRSPKPASKPRNRPRSLVAHPARWLRFLGPGLVTGAADGYARMKGKPAATLLHCGPGLANGMANIHNAKRAKSPMVNVVGDHATYHQVYDTPLTSDVEGMARTVSHWVRTSRSGPPAPSQAVRSSRR